MKTIWKFPFQIGDFVRIDMPSRSQILHVDAQDSQPTIWALVDTEAQRGIRIIRVLGTGHQILDKAFSPGPHIGTFQDGKFVWHVFDGGEISP